MNLNEMQYEILMGLLSSSDSSMNIEEYLKYSIKILYSKLNPIAIAAYVSIKAEDKLVLVGELGNNFDEQIEPVYDFSLMVRTAIKKRDVVFVPDQKDYSDISLDISIVLIPVIGIDENIGMIGMIFKIEDLQEQKAKSEFYLLVSRIVGLVGQMRKMISASNKTGPVDPDEDHTEKIMSLGILSSGVAHEFNNILAVIKGYAELIMMKNFDRSTIENAVKIVDNQTERGAELIERLSVFSRGRVNKLEYHSLNEIINIVIEMQEATLKEENIEVKKIYSDIPKVLIDKNQIKEVLLNLILNARHAIRPNGTGVLDIETDYIDERVVLRIRDDGVGMSKEHADIAINPFFTTKGSLGGEIVDGKKTGTGLGLAIAYGIMESHGGSLTIMSEPDAGTEVKVIFNRTELGEDLSSKYKDKEIVYFGDARILIVDDEDAIREFLTSAFDRIGYQVISVANGEEAVEICSFENIDIVFLDYLMPGLKGDRVFELIKKVSPDTDVVFITGANEIPDIDAHLNKGLAYVLKKPFKIVKLIKVTNELIYKRISRKDM